MLNVLFLYVTFILSIFTAGIILSPDTVLIGIKRKNRFKSSSGGSNEIIRDVLPTPNSDSAVGLSIITISHEETIHPDMNVEYVQEKVNNINWLVNKF